MSGSAAEEHAPSPGPRPRRRSRRGGRRRRKGRGALPPSGPGPSAPAPDAASSAATASRDTAASAPRIYTRGGDRGETGLLGGQRVPKDHPRVEAYGAVDELNAALGLARALTGETDLLEVFDRVQHRLFDLGAELAAPAPAETPSVITESEVRVLEGVIDLYQETLPPLRAFILPAGTTLAAALHLARTVCRRAERRVVTLARAEPVNPEILRYLNRLSDLLFVLARVANERGGVADVAWQKGRAPRAPEAERLSAVVPAPAAGQAPAPPGEVPPPARPRRRRGRRRGRRPSPPPAPPA